MALQSSVIPFVDIYHGIHDNNATVSWDTAITKLAGLDRWRFIVTVEGINLSDGTRVRGGMLKIFVRLRYSQQHSMFDARSALISYTPMGASQYEVTAVRASAEENGDVSVYFNANSLPKTGLGWSKAIVTATETPNYVKSTIL